MTVAISHRDVPIDDVRTLARDRSERTSLRQLAPEIGVGHSTLHNFLRGAAPHPRVRRLLGLWYLRVTGGSPEAIIVRPYVAAIDLLVADVPESERHRIRDELPRWILERGYLATGNQSPGWLVAILAQRECVADPEDSTTDPQRTPAT